MCSNIHKQHMMAQKPLKLKDYLELDLSSESNGSGFLCAPRRPHASAQRRLAEANGIRPGAGCGRKLVRAQSRSAFSRLSAMVSAVRFLPFSGGKSGVGLSRNLSRRLKGTLWKKWVSQAPPEVENHQVGARHIDQVSSSEADVESRRSFDFPSPVVSICSSWSETASSSSDFSPSSSSSDTLDEIPCIVVAGVAEVLASAGELPLKDMQKEEMESLECHMQEEEKEQLSPVSVMDFPYEEDDHEEDANDSAFRQILTNIDGAKRQQKTKRIPRFDDVDRANLAERFEDASVSGDHHVAASKKSLAEDRTAETRAWDLLDEVKATFPEEAPHGGFEKLLLDFFVHGLRRIDQANLGRPFGPRGTAAAAALVSRDGPDQLLGAARDWIRGDVKGSDKETTIMDMERDGRWRCVDEDEEELVGEDLEGLLLDSLVEELVLDYLGVTLKC